MIDEWEIVKIFNKRTEDITNIYHVMEFYDKKTVYNIRKSLERSIKEFNDIYLDGYLNLDNLEFIDTSNYDNHGMTKNYRYRFILNGEEMSYTRFTDYIKDTYELIIVKNKINNVQNENN